MKNTVFCWRRAFAVLALFPIFILLGAEAMLASSAPRPVYTLEGESPEVRHESHAGVRLTVLGWSAPEDQQTVLNAVRAWQSGGSDDELASLLRQQPTRGYLFTGEATGYTIKYAAEDQDGHASLLVVPGLKTKHRYLWKEPPADDEPPFTLLSLEWLEPGEHGLLRTSLGQGIRVNDSGDLLQLTEQGEPFAEVKDATPYYLKRS